MITSSGRVDELTSCQQKWFCGFFVPLGTPCSLLAVNVCALCV